MNAVKEVFGNVRRQMWPSHVEQQYVALKHYAYYRELRTRTDIRSFEPFDRYRCIFIHIPKNGGMAINKAIFDGNMIGGHYAASFFKIIFKEHFNEYFKFAIVRNPWDRLVSAYEFMKGGGMYEGDRLWAEKNIGQFRDFKSFVNSWLNGRNIRKKIHFNPQTELICDRTGKPAVDYIGRFEHFEESFSEICRRMNLKDRVLSQTNSSDRKKDYRIYYGDKEAERVAQVYKSDINTFGYTFE